MTDRPRVSPLHLALYGFGVAGIAVASLGFSTSVERPALASPLPVAPGLPVVADGPSCPLSVKEQVDAVKAFGKMLPVFRHPRCLNCHGGLDPMSEKHPGKDQLEGITNDSIFLATCQDCHDGLKGWHVPGEGLFFVGKSDEELCKQMKGFGLTAERFVSHIHDDEGGTQFIAAAFVGDRALGEGLADYHLEIAKPPGTQAELTAKARKWVDAMGGNYVGSPECGCAMPKIKLAIEHRSAPNTASAEFRAGWAGFEGIARFELTLIPQEGFAGRYRGEATLVRSMQVQFAARGCRGTASQTEHWWFYAEVDETSATMRLTFGFLESDRRGSAECTTGGYISRPQINPNLFHDLDFIVMPLDRGATKEETLEDPLGTAQEWITVKVVAVPGN
jgi:hypothetical protein